MHEVTELIDLSTIRCIVRTHPLIQPTTYPSIHVEFSDAFDESNIAWTWLCSELHRYLVSMFEVIILFWGFLNGDISSSSGAVCGRADSDVSRIDPLPDLACNRRSVPNLHGVPSVQGERCPLISWNHSAELFGRFQNYLFNSSYFYYQTIYVGSQDMNYYVFAFKLHKHSAHVNDSTCE